MGMLSAPNGTLEAKTTQHLVQFWIPQTATHAYGIDGQSKYISKSNGTRACWTHVERYRTLIR